MIFHCIFRGEDGMEFQGDIIANSRTEAKEISKHNYPESTLLELYSPNEPPPRHEGHYYDLEEYRHGC